MARKGEFEEMAKTLMELRAGLGPFYDEQKQEVINQVLALPLAEAPVILNSLLGLEFINREELNGITKRLLSRPAAAPPVVASVEAVAKPAANPAGGANPQAAVAAATPVSNVAPNNQPGSTAAPVIPSSNKSNNGSDLWGSTTPSDSTQLSSLQDVITKNIVKDSQKTQSLIALLASLNAHTVKELMSLDADNRAHSTFLADVMGPLYESYEKVLAAIKELPCNDGARRKEEEKNKSMLQLYHLWNADSQIVVVPVERSYHFYCSIEATPAEALAKGEHLIFCLDISASMNHDENRKFCSPKSLDHVASSIKQARDLIPQLAFPAIKRNTSVTIIVWNFEIKDTIEFKPETFLDQESGEYKDDDFILGEIKRLSSENMFRAHGGTNIEAGLLQISKKLKDMSKDVSTFTVWFLTDGEETVYNDDAGNPTGIPTNPKDAKYSYFNDVDEAGISVYQKKLVATMAMLKNEMSQRQCCMNFHVCHLGEAHPLFLKSICDAVDGHFHTFVDVANMSKEIHADVLSANSTISITGMKGVSVNVPASITDGFLCSRGTIPQNLFEDLISSKKISLRTTVGREILLSLCQSLDLADDVRASVAAIVALETYLGKLLASISGEVTIDQLRHVSEKLRGLRYKRMQAVQEIPRSARANAILIVFLEKVLESVETQMNSLSRLLDQYLSPSALEYNKRMADKNEMLSMKEKLAISAGVDSMRVQLGKGFVSKANLDKHLKRMVAEQGPRALRMLERVCLLAETLDKEAHVTKLSIFILEGRELKEARNKIVKDLLIVNKFAEDSATQFTQTLQHEGADNSVFATVNVVVLDKDSNAIGNLQRKAPIKELYPRVLASYTCAPLTADLDDACKAMLDPLSFCSFLDLIRENNTLPAYLYTVAQTQSVGLFFNAKEMLHVISGGSDATSLDYFRLFWRLADKDEKNCVKVPGTFSLANSALPIAPEPLTNLVLSNLMPGLLCEFITGTPMTPMPAICDLYIGYLLMHMRSKHTGVDITRIGEILSTIGCWIDNPNTMPKPETFVEYVDQIVTDRAVSNLNSPGKHLPVKALAYLLLADKYTLHVKHEILLSEAVRRNFKLLLCPQRDVGKNPKISPDHAAQQVAIEEFLKDLVENLAENKNFVDEVPVEIIKSAEKIANLVADRTNKEKILEFMSVPKNLEIITSSVWALLVKTNLAFVYDFRWPQIQRMMFVWYSVGSYSHAQLKATYHNFKKPAEFEAHMEKLFAVLREKEKGHSAFHKTLTAWLEPVDGANDGAAPRTYKYMVLSRDEEGKLVVQDFLSDSLPLSIQDCSASLKETVLLKLWGLLFPILDMWYWNSRSSTVFGLHKLDYDVVRALRDPSLIGSLSQVQASEFHSAMEYKLPAYSAYVGEKPAEVRLTEEASYVARQVVKDGSHKPRLSVIMLGHTDSGKSTTAGHLIWKCGGIDKRQMEKYVIESGKMGKGSFKYAWILDRLKHERERGLTIEVSTWNIETKNFAVDILNAPGGHFVKNMMVGVSLADVAALVVAASQGEFEAGIARGGMTREESWLAYSMGIKQIIVLVNKMDTVGYSQSRFDEIKGNVVDYLRKVGYKPEGIIVVPISGFNGENLVAESDNTVNNMPWYTGWKATRPNGQVVSGMTFYDAINDGIEPPLRELSAPLRIPILYTVKVGGVGTVAVGRVVSGTLRAGDVVQLQPAGISAQAKTLEIYHNNRQEVYPGELVGMAIKSVAVNDIPRGMVACLPNDRPAKAITEFTARIVVLNHPGQLKAGYSPYMCAHTCTLPVRFEEIVSKVDRRSGSVIEDHPKTIKSGDGAIIRMIPHKPICVDTYAACSHLGRFVLKEKNIVALGLILSVVEKTVVVKAPQLKTKHTIVKPAKKR